MLCLLLQPFHPLLFPKYSSVLLRLWLTANAIWTAQWRQKVIKKRRVSEAENSTQEAQLEVPISTCVSDPTSDMRWWMETDCTQFIAIKGFPGPCFRWPIWTITWVDLFVCPCVQCFHTLILFWTQKFATTMCGIFFFHFQIISTGVCTLNQ